jgi:hypothetical protein
MIIILLLFLQKQNLGHTHSLHTAQVVLFNLSEETYNKSIGSSNQTPLYRSENTLVRGGVVIVEPNTSIPPPRASGSQHYTSSY